VTSDAAPAGTLLALDFGGTKLTAAVADLSTLEWRQQASCPTPASGAQSREAITALAREMLTPSLPPIAGIGVSFGGPVDAARGHVVHSMHIPGWNDYPLAAGLSKAFGAPASIANDARAGALGEWRFGTGGARGSLFYLTVSTGVGGGLVIDGEPVEGSSGLAGEVGHLTIDPSGPMCSCGRRGCVEALAAGPAIGREASRRIAADKRVSPALAALLAAQATLTGEDVGAAAAAGDQVAIEVMTTAGSAAGHAIAAVIAVANPDVVAVGGGVTKSDGVFWTSLKAAAIGAALPTSTSVVRAAFVDTAPLYGALELARRAVCN